MEKFPEGPGTEFWAFTLKVYGEKGMSEALIALQDGYSADVNILLFCLWAAVAGHKPFAAAQLEKATNAVFRWQNEVIVPIREIRRLLKSPESVAGASDAVQQLALTLRETVKSAELAGEHAAQNILAATLERRGDVPNREQSADSGAANLATYFQLAGVTPDDALRRAAETLIGAVFKDSSGDAAATIERHFP